MNLGQEWMNRVKSLTELENTKKNQTELKIKITEIKNILEGIKSKLDGMEEQCSAVKEKWKPLKLSRKRDRRVKQIKR